MIAASRAGKHVLCEKPMAVDVRECDDMIDACARASVKLQLGFMRRASRRVRYAPTKGGAREADRIGAD